ncbi:AEC family transporter [Anaerotalea alkaliphila]|uniref:Membrane transport protein n=1 Tax=Anaerotalea alkaliphila TaxID=2662126 RepID=A0A7X5KMB1_9FIRM|nr:hypothetical protein [Anaerotalea alkaliphila]NDL67771.1 hypothetical protein [Anaerotalea alkaliphila]
MNELIVKTMPIFLFIGMGYFFKTTQFLTSEQMGALKKLVVNMVLPAVLFLTFLRMEIGLQVLGATLGIILMCSIFMGLGYLLNLTGLLKNPTVPFMMTSFAFGFLGIALFATVFGEENLQYIALLGIGHELFVWTLYVLFMKVRLGEERVTAAFLMAFLRSPIILGVVLGILLNVAGLYGPLQASLWGQGILSTIQMVTALSSPLIFLIVGHGIAFDRKYILQSFWYTVLRYLLIFSAGYLFKFLVLDRFLEQSQLMDYAFFVFLLLPPPVSLPILIASYSKKQEHVDLTNNMVVFSTIASLLLFMGFVVWKGI